MKARKTDKGKITALYECLSRNDDLTGDSNSIINQKKLLELMQPSDIGTQQPQPSNPIISPAQDEANKNEAQDIVIDEPMTLNKVFEWFSMLETK